MSEPAIRTLSLGGLSATVLPGGYLTRADAARMLGVTAYTMGNWAKRGIGPACTRAGPHLNIYALQEVEAFRDERGRAA